MDGGNLRLYIGAEADDITGITAVEVLDIEPLGGRILLFDSQVVLHEVMQTHKDRYAITVWFTIDS